MIQWGKSHVSSESTGTQHHKMLGRRGNLWLRKLVWEGFNCPPSPESSRKCQSDPTQAVGWIPRHKISLSLQMIRYRTRAFFNAPKLRCRNCRTFLFDTLPEPGNWWNGGETRFLRQRTTGSSSSLGVTTGISLCRWLATWRAFQILMPLLKAFKLCNQLTKLCPWERAAHSRYLDNLGRDADWGTWKAVRSNSKRKVQRHTRDPTVTSPRINPTQTPSKAHERQLGLQWKGQDVRRLTSPATDNQAQNLSKSTTIYLSSNGHPNAVDFRSSYIYV